VKALLVMLMVASLSVPVQAQPQAPVAWGEARWAYLAGWPGLPQITTLRVIPMGDTLLFTALNVGNPVSDTILVCSSFDNGQTFTPWHGITQGNESVSVQYAASAGRHYAFFSQGSVPPAAVWMRTSDDGGVTWSGIQQYREDAYGLYGFAAGNQVLVKYAGLVGGQEVQFIIQSNNGGQTWSVPILIDSADFLSAYADQSIAFTQSHRLIVEKPSEWREDYRLYVARGDSSGQDWTQFELLPGQNNEDEAAMRRAIAGDTASEVAGVQGDYGDRHNPDAPLQPYLFRTTSGGESWQMRTSLSNGQWVIWYLFATHVPANVCQGKLWLQGWEQDDPQGWNFLGTRFSANHGKNWYRLQVAADSLAQSKFFSGQIRGNRIDLYWAQGCCGQAQPWDYRMVTGTITPDTLFPVVAPVASIPETVLVRQHLLFGVTATDDDTLSQVRLVIVELSGDTLRYGMAQGADHLYQFTWVVPDSGYYVYWYEAEDFWENIATLPDSGTFHFVTEGWSASDDFILHPLSFILSVFPNPCNTWPALTLSPEWLEHGPVEISVYNALGQEVVRQTTTSTSVSFPPDVPTASGTYLLQVSSSQHSALQKFIVLK